MSRPCARKMHLEVAVFSAESALTAQTLGASRVELNAAGSYSVGGLTPTIEELSRLRAQPRKLTLPVHVMVRPRGAPAEGPDFVYSARELAEMFTAICRFKASGLMNPLEGDRFVFGAVTEVDNDEDVPGDKRIEIDDGICTALIEVATPFGCVFHRAFDPIAASGRSIDGAEQLAKLGFQGLLTAGGLNSSCCNQDSVDKIGHMCHRMAGKIKIIAGGGLRRHNVAKAAAQLAVYDDNTVWFHTAAVKTINGVPTENLDADELVDVLTVLGQVQPA
ncbi:Copper homeostasis protein cutC [Tolypocladium ophioglossoides CBS 100239]|uniref:Copper homeostasis protein cutC homolog n=1 Tax=Tolypocladium ophioglossoides (strain CBS 100239) TaxID=1163406 RepID=A0A0L0NHD5_TOLOC|nr:Copper homeostasis protein cutC [Tolypocladium ophioglossoides CBS 100239]